MESATPTRRLRILEIGAGTGATTSSLLPALPIDRTDYSFTDIGPFFVSRAREQFAQYPFVSYAVLDIDRQPEQQGYALHSYDVVIAANVLHATRNLGKSLKYVRSLLAPGGLLILYEATQYHLYFDVAFPLLPPFDPDDLRAGTPFLSAGAWSNVLKQNGFAAVAALPDTDCLGAHIVAAQATATGETLASSDVDLTDAAIVPSQRPTLTTAHVAAETDIEKTIAEIWQKALGIDQVGVHDNFFELGGDSLLAVHIISKLRGTYHVELSSHSLLEHFTISALAEHIVQLLSTLADAAHPSTEHSTLVRLRAGTLSGPLYLIHAAGGHAYLYHALARSLHLDVPIYGLQAQGIDGRQDPLDTLEAMASQYVAAILTAQPRGPYFLGGSCLGGVLAYEMARQLRQGGHEVALLAMLDAFVPRPSDLGHADDAMMLAFMLNLGLDGSDVTTPLRALSPDERLVAVLDQARAVHQNFPDITTDQLRILFRIFKTTMHALWNYTPGAYSGALTMFYAMEAPHNGPKIDQQAWRQLAANFESFEVPGNHISMIFAPHVQVLGEQLTKCITRAREVYGI